MTAIFRVIERDQADPSGDSHEFLTAEQLYDRYPDLVTMFANVFEREEPLHIQFTADTLQVSIRAEYYP